MWFVVGEVVIVKVEEGVFDVVVDILQVEFRIGLNVVVDIVMFFYYCEYGFVVQCVVVEQVMYVFLLWLQMCMYISN